MRRTRAEIDLKALGSNLKLLRSFVGDKVKISGVVKGNAYGHGIVSVAKKLVALGIDSLCVAYLQEGAVLRDNGIKTPILLIGPFSSTDIPEIAGLNLTPTIYDTATLEGMASFAKTKSKEIGVHVKVDSGMNRLGFRIEEAQKTIDALKQTGSLKVLGLSSHFFESDNRDQGLTMDQLRKFREFSGMLEKALKVSTTKHIANTAGLSASKDYHMDMVRPGLFLYGYSMFTNDEINGSLKKVLSLKSWVSSVKRIKKGEYVGYGRRFKAESDRTVGIIPIGYADGYLRRNSQLGYVLLNGKKCPTIGSVCMDMTFCDLTDCPSVNIGDEVTLLGKDGIEIDAFDYADATGTIPYEILTSISERVPRIFLDEDKT